MARTLDLSGEQSEAVRSFGSDIGLSASAGSGKTTVLVEKYLEALKIHACSPQNILAVTFTDKAAGSMKQRLVRRCRELGLHGIARELENAWIGTLHSFCARLLRENPVECGVDPQFQILAQGEQDQWMREISEELFQRYADDPSVSRLLADIGEASLVSGLGTLYDADRAHARDPRLFHIPLYENERKALERQMLEQAYDLERIFAAQTSLSTSQSRQQAETKRFQSIFKKMVKPSWERWSAVTECIDAFDLRSVKTRSAAAALKEAGEAWGSMELQILGLDAKRTLIKLYEEFRGRYEDQKREKGLYDFEDLLFLAHRALSGETDAQRSLRSRYQKQFEAIFVDEYQDTSQLQARILDRIKRPTNLFVVGDSFQSIYGFRHASPELFEQAMKNSKRLELRENYRSRQEILDFVNGLFAQLFTGRFMPMSAMRKHSPAQEPCVDWISVPREPGLELDVFRVLEARTLAQRIRQMIDSGVSIEDEKGRRALQYKDIAILFRKTTSSRIFEKELEACAIPYFVHKGRGFFERLEIVDLIQMLIVLDDPHQDIPLAAVLRSPLVQLSDDALFWLAKARRSAADPFYDAVRRWEDVAELNESDRSKLRIFMDRLARLKFMKERSTVSQLLREILSLTAYEAKLLTQKDGRLAQANVQKLLEMAETHEEKSASGSSSFVRTLQRMSESEESEPEARLIGEEENVVRILTVHAAKGLEFPCVALADLGGKICPSNHTSFGASPDFGLGLKVRIKDRFSSMEDHSLAQLIAGQKTKEEEEQSRLLYVAMTRAKDHLILSGVHSPGSWTEKLAQLLGDPMPLRSIPVHRQKPPAVITRKERLIDRLRLQVDGPAIPPPAVLRLKVDQKPYQMLEDITVSDVLHVVTQEEIEMLPQPSATDEDEMPRNEYGTLFHKLMELSVRSSARGTVTPATAERLLRALSPDQKNEMMRSFGEFWRTPVAQEIMRSRRVYPELPFIYKTPHGLLKGQIDLLYEDPKGDWVVLDYKTNRLKPDELGLVAKRYEWQLGLYALIFKDLYGTIPTRGTLYFSSINKFSETQYTAKALEKLSEDLKTIYPKVAFA